MYGRVGGKRGWNGNGGDEMPVMAEHKRSVRQPMPLIKQTNVSTQALRTQSAVGTVCKGWAINTVRRASKAEAVRDHRPESQVHDGER